VATSPPPVDAIPLGSVVRVPDRRGHRFGTVTGIRRRRGGRVVYEVDVVGRRRLVESGRVLLWRASGPPEGRLF
jgi:hypothetical protein